MFVNPTTVRLLGKRIPHGERRRTGYPVQSPYDDRKKAKKRTTASETWAATLNQTQLNEHQIETRLVLAIEKRDSAAAGMKLERMNLAKVMEIKDTASKAVKEGVAGSYPELRLARQKVREATRRLTDIEHQQRESKHDVYVYNKLLEASRKAKGSSEESGPASSSNQATAPLTAVSWDRPATQEATSRLDVSDLKKDVDAGRGIFALSGTDYGVVCMSETTAMSQKQLLWHTNQFSSLEGKITTLWGLQRIEVT